MTAIRATVSRTGMLHLPEEIRRATGLQHGGEVVVEFCDGDILIRALDDVIAAAQQATRLLLGDNPDASVDSFLAERRRAASQE
jgi:bifunctional DNA-binding transcriptional regulator/antitoxin component of YhaV-PrlF toxin-antitoxin module